MGLVSVAMLPIFLSGNVELPQARTDIILGASNVQSGPTAALGKNLMLGSQILFDHVNRTGGIHGSRIVVRVLDDRYEPDPAVQNTNTFLNDANVVLLFNYVGTPTLTRVLPLLRYYADRKVPMIGPFTGAAPQRHDRYNGIVFNVRDSYLSETKELVDYFVGQGIRNIGVLAQSDAYGKSGELGVRQALEPYGLRPASVATFRRNQDFGESMAKQVDILRKAGSQAVICIGTYSTCGAFIRDARQSGWMIPIANVSFVDADSLLALLSDESRNSGIDMTADLINSQVVPPPTDRRYPLVREYLSRIGTAKPNFVSLEGFLNAKIIVEALERAGPNPSRDAVVQALMGLGGWDPGVGVPLQFGPASNQGLRRVWLTKTQSGRWVEVDRARS